MNTKIKNGIGLLMVVIATLGFFWLANLLGSGEKAQSEKPLVICNPPNASPEQQQCNWTAHIHFTLKVFKGNQEVPVRFEQGDLQAMHTHAELNKIHWHGLIPVDSKTKKVADWSSLEVQNISRDMKLAIKGTPKFIVNGKEVDPSYLGQDSDAIEIHYE